MSCFQELPRNEAADSIDNSYTSPKHENKTKYRLAAYGCILETMYRPGQFGYLLGKCLTALSVGTDSADYWLIEAGIMRLANEVATPERKENCSELLEHFKSAQAAPFCEFNSDDGCYLFGTAFEMIKVAIEDSAVDDLLFGRIYAIMTRASDYPEDLESTDGYVVRTVESILFNNMFALGSGHSGNYGKADPLKAALTSYAERFPEKMDKYTVPHMRVMRLVFNLAYMLDIKSVFHCTNFMFHLFMQMLSGACESVDISMHIAVYAFAETFNRYKMNALRERAIEYYLRYCIDENSHMTRLMYFNHAILRKPFNGEYAETKPFHIYRVETPRQTTTEASDDETVAVSEASDDETVAPKLKDPIPVFMFAREDFLAPKDRSHTVVHTLPPGKCKFSIHALSLGDWNTKTQETLRLISDISMPQIIYEILSIHADVVNMPNILSQPDIIVVNYTTGDFLDYELEIDPWIARAILG